MLAVTLFGSAAFGADIHGPLPAGKPAGIKAAQLDTTDMAVIATTAAILVTALVVGVTQHGYTYGATATSNTTATSTSP
jgi:hypothetical protein